MGGEAISQRWRQDEETELRGKPNAELCDGGTQTLWVRMGLAEHSLSNTAKSSSMSSQQLSLRPLPRSLRPDVFASSHYTEDSSGVFDPEGSLCLKAKRAGSTLQGLSEALKGTSGNKGCGYLKMLVLHLGAYKAYYHDEI